MKRQKLLHILKEIRYSGAEVMVYDAQAYFQEQGLEGSVLARGEEKGAYAAVLEQKGYPVYHLVQKRNIQSVYDLYRFIKKHSFEVVHVHLEGMCLWNCLAARLANPSAKIVYTVHDVFIHYTPYERRKRTLHRFLYTHLLGVKGVAISESVQEVEEKYFHHATEIVYNWIDEQEFHPPPRPNRSVKPEGHWECPKMPLYCLPWVPAMIKSAITTFSKPLRA